MRHPIGKKLMVIAISLVLSSGALAAGSSSSEESVAPDRRGAEKGADYMRPVISGALLNRQVDQLTGMDVHNQKGETIGEVDRIVLDAETNRLYAVISVGGLFGIGDKLIPIGMERLTLQDEKLYMPTSLDQYELQNTTAYNDAKYMELEGDQLLSDLKIRSDHFAQLDENMDGYINHDEAIKFNEELAEEWESLDANRDERLNRSEFSAFEQMKRDNPASEMKSEEQGY